MNEYRAHPSPSGLSPERWRALSPLLDEALDLSTEARAPWLAALARRDAALHADLVALLARDALVSAEGFLRDTVLPRPATPASPGLEVGAYTLVSPLGAGGMGTVWRARRSDGRYSGEVAIKLLDVSLAGAAGEARFMREGTILARLRHPHVAQLLDAGVTTQGQPYLVIELVEGVHIDGFCREQPADLDARLRLFLDVLDAVSHAHANLIVHRDLKPSNVLVRADGTVKLLDFGIAALLDGDADITGLTRDGAHPLTPAYAAPEQVTGAPITTATDVYALGLLLHVMLGAPHPVTSRARTPADLVETIVSHVPPCLSTVSPFGRALRGDLDTIAARALEKDPARRYASVQAFADDVRRAMRHEPIAARPHTLAYRARRFLRRRRTAVMVGVAVTLLVAGIVGFYTWRVAGERDRARLEAMRAQRVTALLTNLLTTADPYKTPEGEPTLQAVLARGAAQVRRDLADEPQVRAELLAVIGRVQQRLGRHADAEPVLVDALATARQVAPTGSVGLAAALNNLGTLRVEMGRPAEGLPLLEEALALRRQYLGARHADVAITLVELGRAYQDVGRLADAERLYREALAIRLEVFGERHRETATSQTELGLLLRQRGRPDEAEALLRTSLATSRAVLPADHPNVASGWNNLAFMLIERGQYAAAEQPLRESLAIKRRHFGARHAELGPSLSNLSFALRELGRLDEAQAAVEDAIAVTRDGLGDAHPSLATFLVNLGRVHLARGDRAQAERVLRDAIARQTRALAQTDWRRGVTASLLAEVLMDRGAYDEARPLLAHASSVLADVPGRQGIEAAATRQRLRRLEENAHEPKERSRSLSSFPRRSR